MPSFIKPFEVLKLFSKWNKTDTDREMVKSLGVDEFYKTPHFTPDKPDLYFLSLAIFLAVSVTVGCVLGLLVKNQSKITMISQIVFLPSIMLSGIMFSSDLLPYALKIIGKFFPASWGYSLMLNSGFSVKNLIPLLIIFLLAAIAISIMLKLKKSDI